MYEEGRAMRVYGDLICTLGDWRETCMLIGFLSFRVVSVGWVDVVDVRELVPILRCAPLLIK